MNSMKRQKGLTLKDELPKSVGPQYATGDQWRNNSRKNEETESNRKKHPGEESRWRGNRTGRSLSLLQIHGKNNRTVNKVSKTTSDR